MALAPFGMLRTVVKMNDFTTAVAFVLNQEGGLADDPNDPGGITNMGISFQSFPSLGKEGIRNLTKDQAISIYERYYWQKLNCDALPYPLALAVFDHGVNMGVYGAASILQGVLGIQRDGIIGPQTVAEAKAREINPLLSAYFTERIMKYTQLTTFVHFGRGWIRRVCDLAQVCYAH